MSVILKIFLLSCGLVFLFTVINLLIKKKISEWNVIIWLSGAVAILLLSANPEWVDWAAQKLGISYPPSLLFLFSTLVLLVIVLYQSMQISALQSRVRQIVQHVAVQPHLDANRRQLVAEVAVSQEEVSNS
jgi:hypothetical protein